MTIFNKNCPKVYFKCRGWVWVKFYACFIFCAARCYFSSLCGKPLFHKLHKNDLKSRKKQSVSKSFSPCDKFYSNKFSSWRKFISFLSSQMRLFPIYCYLLDFLGVNRTHHKRKKETRAQTEQFAPLSEQHRRGPSPAFCVQTVKFPGIAVLFFTLEVRCSKIGSTEKRLRNPEF